MRITSLVCEEGGMFCWKHHCWAKGYTCRLKSFFSRLTQLIILLDPFGPRRFASITLSQRPLRVLCSFEFGTARLEAVFENIIFEISILDYPVRSLEASRIELFLPLFTFCDIYVHIKL